MRNTLKCSMLAAAAAFAVAPGASALTVRSQGSSIIRNWPSHAGYTVMNAELTPLAVTTDAPYFWAHQVTLHHGGGGYIGLQSNGSRWVGPPGKTVIFSLWEAEGWKQYQYDTCMPFWEDGEGYSCRMAYDWQFGHKYRLSISFAGTDASGTWWAGSVVDTTIGVATKIGDLHVPTKDLLGWWTATFTEYFGPTPASCAALPYSKVQWGRLSATANQTPSNELYYYGGEHCGDAKLTDLGAGNILQEAGPAPVTTTTNTNTTGTGTVTNTGTISPPVHDSSSIPVTPTAPQQTVTTKPASKAKTKPKRRCKRVVRRHRSARTGKIVRRTVAVCPKKSTKR